MPRHGDAAEFALSPRIAASQRLARTPYLWPVEDLPNRRFAPGSRCVDGSDIRKPGCARDNEKVQESPNRTKTPSPRPTKGWNQKVRQRRSRDAVSKPRP